MKIPAEFLAEKNYEGSRLIEVTDPTVMKLRAKVAELAEPAKPFLAEMEKLGKVLDPFYVKIGKLNEEIKKIKEEMAPTKELFDKEVAELEKIEQKAQLIKNKIQPLVNELMKGQLSEFERANQLIDRDNKLFVEVIDEIEEKIKAVRAQKANKK